jgi:hypothetical protein
MTLTLFRKFKFSLSAFILSNPGPLFVSFFFVPLFDLMILNKSSIYLERCPATFPQMAAGLSIEATDLSITCITG